MAAPRKKPAAPAFPPDSCGVCTFCVSSDGSYFCCAMPPVFSGQDDEGYALCDRFAPVELEDPPCIYFKQRCNA